MQEPVRKPQGSWWALSPLAVFLCLYLVTSIWMNDFYKVPITVAFMFASCYAIATTRHLKLDQRIFRFSIGAGNKNILLMIWIFILAGSFAQSAKQMGAIDATVNLTLHILPENLLLAGIFLASCFISLSIGYPCEDEEIRMLKIVGDEIPFDKVNAVADSNTIIQAQEECRKVHVSDSIDSYIVKITNETRKDPRLSMGASPRASRALYQASKAWAAMNGRTFVTPDDVKDIVYDVLVHRMMLEESAEFSGLTVREVLSQILNGIEASVSAKEEVNA